MSADKISLTGWFSGFRKKVLPVCIVVVSYIGIDNHSYAGSRSMVMTWPSTDTIAPGALAQTCTFSWSDIKPFQNVRSLVVDSTAPVGTVLHSWGYGEFADYTYHCTGGEVGRTSSGTTSVGGFSKVILGFGNYSPGDYENVLTTGIDGIGLRLYITPQQVNSDSVGLYQFTLNNVSLPVEGETLPSPRSGNINITMHAYSRNQGDNTYKYGEINIVYSLRAELIKIGDIPLSAYGSRLTSGFNTTYNQVFGSANNTTVTGDTYSTTEQFSGNGITIVSPACMLNNENYDVNMGDWVAYTWGGAVRRGNEKLVDISLKCTGAANNVYFRFEDAGTATASTDKNIRVYKSVGSGTDVVDGLEIELLYDGEHVDVDGITLTDTGTHGSYVSTNNSETQLYSSQSTARFTARFLQNGQISYLGPVTGKVNMWVTYE